MTNVHRGTQTRAESTQVTLARRPNGRPVADDFPGGGTMRCLPLCTSRGHVMGCVQMLRREPSHEAQLERQQRRGNEGPIGLSSHEALLLEGAVAVLALALDHHRVLAARRFSKRAFGAAAKAPLAAQRPASASVSRLRSRSAGGVSR